MSTPSTGLPVGPDTEPSARALVFDHIPHLTELIPNGGWPGVIYAQVCVHNQKRATDREDYPANLRPIRNATYYTIAGPKGDAAMALMGTGKPIPGAAPEAGARYCFTDGEVGTLTGHEVAHPIWFRSPPKEKPDAEVIPVTQTAEGSGGPSRVQGGGASQRQQARPQGDKP